MKPILILGAGNLLMGDDGVGVRTVHFLASEFSNLSSQIELLDGGTLGPDLLPHFSGRKKVIIIDAMLSAEEPGTLVSFIPVLSFSATSHFSLHHAGVMDTLGLLALSDDVPEVEIIGISARKVNALHIGLTPEVEAAIPVAAKKAIESANQFLSLCLN